MPPARFGVLAVALSLSMVFLAVPPAAAQCPTCIAQSGIRHATETDEDKIIPASFVDRNDAQNCAWQGSCPDYEDVTFVDVDISEAMESYEEFAAFELTNRMFTPTTFWYVCSYDGSGEILDCMKDEDRGDGFHQHFSGDARELRLFPIQSPATEYRLRLSVT